MAKYRIPLSELPPPNEDGDHIFRFRVVSEDKIRYSEYSSLYVIQSSGQVFPEVKTETQYRLSRTSASVINLTWDAPTKYNVGSKAQTAFNFLRAVTSIIMVSGSATNIDISNIVPNIYQSDYIPGQPKLTTYNFYEPVTRSDATKVINKLLLQPGVTSGSINEFILTPPTTFPDQSTKFGSGQVDIFVQYPPTLSASTSASFAYYGRTKEGQISFLPESGNWIRVIVQSASYPIQINDNFKIFDTGIFNVATQQKVVSLPPIP